MNTKSQQYIISYQASLAFFVLISFVVLPVCSHAVTLHDSLSVRPQFEFPQGDVDAASYDGLGYNAFKPFETLTSDSVYKVNSFTGQARGSHLEVFLLSEVAAFDGNADPNIANQFGVLDANGNFVSLINSAVDDPLASGGMLQGADEEVTLALQSPEGLFSSLDNDNPDQAAHILAKEVVKDGEVVIQPATLRSNDPVKFSLLAGDVILFIEDLLLTGNDPLLGVPSSSDFDYNDMVLVVRQVEVPEPATILLFGPVLFALRRFKSKSQE